MATLAVAMAQAAPGAAEIPAGAVAVARTMVAAAEVVRRVQPTEDSEHRRAGVIDYARMRGWRNFGGSFGSWNSDLGGKMDANLVPSLLEEFNSNKSRSYELSEIVGHVVEFRLLHASNCQVRICGANTYPISGLADGFERQRRDWYRRNWIRENTILPTSWVGSCWCTASTSRRRAEVP